MVAWALVVTALTFLTSDQVKTEGIEQTGAALTSHGFFTYGELT